ncbi:MAG: hypothetical protein LBH07_04750, partial [Treponema sp.]|nr:hypothetical protein [Treponema sp.]
MKNVVLKRACFIGIAVLFVLAIAACNAFLNPGNQVNEPVHFTEDGRPMVELTINTGANSRAMTQTLAQAAVDYYEVVFYDGT